MRKETTKEAAERMSTRIMEILFKDEKKWQQERSYSKEDLEVAFFEGQFGRYSFNDWFEQFKKK